MKHLRLLAVTFALTACAAASIAIACGNKGTSATAASAKSGDACCAASGKTTATAASVHGKKAGAGACTADMAAQCTPEMKAACAGMKNTATAASMDHCAGMKNTATAAGASCSMHKSSNTAMMHADCSACEDVAMCEEEVRSTGARSKVVALKNGAMVVYTADTPENVRALQTAVSRRNDLMLTAMKGGTDSKLCGDCRSMRGAMASGKLHREVVNVESGCMTLITSNDRAIVQKIHAMTGAQMAVHVKS